MSTKRWLTVLCAVAGGLAAVGAAPAAAAQVQQAASQNWSGYVAGSGSGTQQFSTVSAGWVQPGATCTGGSGYAAFWVGLGGAGQSQSQSLEQAGTETDCARDGSARYFAWYELVPSAPVHLPLKVSAGDHISSRVAVSGKSVRLTVSDETTGQTVGKTLSMSDPDTSSAEWIAEAPSQCAQSMSQCQTMPLSDFGRINFTNASATSGSGHTGTISDPNWSVSAVTLQPGAGGGYGPQYASAAVSGAGASPSGLSSDGSAFSVIWSADGRSAGGDSAGYSYGGGYGYGGGGGYGYGYGGGGGYGYGGGGGYGYGGTPGYLVLPY